MVHSSENVPSFQRNTNRSKGHTFEHDIARGITDTKPFCSLLVKPSCVDMTESHVNRSDRELEEIKSLPEAHKVFNVVDVVVPVEHVPIVQTFDTGSMTRSRSGRCDRCLPVCLHTHRF